jgi:hypothetical protein
MNSIPSAYCIFCDQNQALEYMARVAGTSSDDPMTRGLYCCSHRGSCAARVHTRYHEHYHSEGCAYCNGKPMGMFDTLTMPETLELETRLNGWAVDSGAIHRFAIDACNTKALASVRKYWYSIAVSQRNMRNEFAGIAIDLRNRAV